MSGNSFANRPPTSSWCAHVLGCGRWEAYTLHALMLSYLWIRMRQNMIDMIMSTYTDRTPQWKGATNKLYHANAFSSSDSVVSFEEAVCGDGTLVSLLYRSIKSVDDTRHSNGDSYHMGTTRQWLGIRREVHPKGISGWRSRPAYSSCEHNIRYKTGLCASWKHSGQRFKQHEDDVRCFSAMHREHTGWMQAECRLNAGWMP
jgi:hypothetical protein